MKKLINILSSIFLASCNIVGIRMTKEPTYQVLKQYDSIEIRHYPALVVAQTEVNADYKDSSRQGFQRLAGYIFGNNKKQQKIAMTAPVMQQKSGAIWLMAFVLPQNYSLASAPIPLDTAVLLKDIPEKKVAVIKYTGSLSEQVIDDKAEELTTWLSKHNYKAISAPRSAAYDPPWTLPFLRRNEVHIDIEH